MGLEYLVVDTLGRIDRILSIKNKIPSLKMIIYMYHHIDKDVVDDASLKGITIKTLKEIQEIGKRNYHELVVSSIQLRCSRMF